jgi:hypothetical protein
MIDVLIALASGVSFGFGVVLTFAFAGVLLFLIVKGFGR